MYRDDLSDCLTLGQRRFVNEFTKFVREWSTHDDLAVAELRQAAIDFYAADNLGAPASVLAELRPDELGFFHRHHRYTN